MAIASCLVDTNILLRVASRSDPQHSLTDTALLRLAMAGTNFYYTHQNIAELWNVITRPLTRNGFGLTVAEAEREVRVIESGMSLLQDGEAVYHEWRRIVVEYGVSGVRVHDARLAAAMYVHRISHILTFNVADFSRFSGTYRCSPEHDLGLGNSLYFFSNLSNRTYDRTRTSTASTRKVAAGW